MVLSELQDLSQQSPVELFVHINLVACWRLLNKFKLVIVLARERSSTATQSGLC